MTKKFTFWRTKPSKKYSRNAKIPKNSQFVVQNRQKRVKNRTKMTIFNDKINFLLNPFLTKNK